MTNQEVYDEEIRPLVQRIVGVCADRGIPMVTVFQLQAYERTENALPLMCSSLVTGSAPSPWVEDLQALLRARRTLGPQT